MATSLGEGKLWIPTNLRPGEGWALPYYSCSRHTTWVVPPQPYQLNNKKNYVSAFVTKKTLSVIFLK